MPPLIVNVTRRDLAALFSILVSSARVAATSFQLSAEAGEVPELVAPEAAPRLDLRGVGLCVENLRLVDYPEVAEPCRLFYASNLEEKRAS
jgi:hypothetical protein